jgi:hypothetical protein
MSRRRRRFGQILLVIGLCASGCESPKAYMRHPLVKEMRVMKDPVVEPERATQAEPFAPPRPNMPSDPLEFPTTTVIRTPEHTPAN